MIPRRWILGATLLAATAIWTGCGSTEVNPETLMLEITSDAPDSGESLDRVRLLFAQSTAEGLLRYPSAPEDGDLQISADFDPVKRAEIVAISHGGDTFQVDGDVLLTVSGLAADGSVLTRFMGVIDLDRPEVIGVHLAALDPGCDQDGDGFPDCTTPGCCEAGEDGTTPMGDCDPTRDDIGPWTTEDPCTQCGDGVDQDCDGEDIPCIDVDQDGVPACLDCDDGDGDIAPGLPELCDGKDNNCNEKTDEAFLGLGEGCGYGECAGGTTVCSEDGTGAVCSTAGFATDSEICGDGLDNDCNNLVDEGCEVTDLDGDGVTEAEGDCNDLDSGYFPAQGATSGAPEPCCLLGEGLLTEELKTACDKNCDGVVDTCAQDDADGDGYGATGGLDCDDSDPMVHPGAQEKCGDEVDQDCFGGDQPCDNLQGALVDNDGDGWFGEGDCDDQDADVNPEAVEKCNAKDDDCDGIVDNGNPDTDGTAVCGTDTGECVSGVKVCAGATGPDFSPGEVTCHGDTTPIAELCDIKDNDCDGSTDEDFVWQPPPLFEESFPMGVPCEGTGECTSGTVVCLDEQTAICSSMIEAGTPGGPNEELCDGLDQDCDGVIDEGISNVLDSTCSFQGVCAVGPPLLKGTCDVGGTGTWTCDYTDVPGWQAGDEPWCDGLDNDCDGLTDDEFQVYTGCDGGDPDDCKNGQWICDESDKTAAICDESNAANVAEICDGEDNDCDNKIDETFDVYPAPISCGVGACVGGQTECTVDGQETQCDTMPAGSDQSHPGSGDKSDPEICNNADDDCDGSIDEGLDSIVDAQCKLAGVCGYEGVTSALCSAGEYDCFYEHEKYQPDNEASLCDGHDNDCDGKLDEDFTGPPAGSVNYTEPNGQVRYLGEPCGLGACWGDSAQNIVQCDPQDSAKLYCPAYLPSSEQCNNTDDDCDDVIDEDYTQSWGTKLQGALYAVDELKQKGDSCGTAVCFNGQVICDPSDAFDLVCSTDGQAVAETCNDIDDDCDGSIDEAFQPGGSEAYSGGPFLADAGKQKGDACGTGLCINGTVICDPNDADELTCSTLGLGGPELCNGVDDDCDGSIDEDFKAGGKFVLEGNVNSDDAGKVLGMSCGFGECDGGVVSCDPDDGSKLTCSTYGNVTDDICDGDDNDCDGGVDEDFQAGGSVVLSGEPYAADAGKVLDDPCGTGSCKNGQVECSNDGLTLECSKWHKAEPEDCDDADNDCDGSVDENFSVGGDQPYTEIFAPFADRYLGESCGTGACAGGQVVCDNDDIVCNTEPLAAAADATCDGEDDDCDGVVDNFFQPGNIVNLDDPYTPDVEELGLGESCGVGACLGTVVCKSNNKLKCSGEGNESADDTCNGEDEDCDALVDDDVPGLGDPCDGADGDLCTDGSLVCPADLSSPDAVCEEPGQGNAEVCNDVDDDCDDEVDETFPLKGTSCDGADADSCAKGMWICQEDGGLACVGDAPNNDELCGGGDEDCDSAVDEGFDLATDVDHCGACNDPCSHATVSSWVCDQGACEIVNCANGQEDLDGDPTNGCEYGCAFAGAELCNGTDDDCDGLTDEDYDLSSDLDHCGACGAPCDHPTVSTWACNAGLCELLTCKSDQYDLDLDPSNGCEYACADTGAEICDGDDNNCDGMIDEGLSGTACDSDGDGCFEGTLSCDGGVGQCVGDGCPNGQVCQNGDCVDP